MRTRRSGDAPTDLWHEAIDRRPAAVGRDLDGCLAAVARELRAGGVRESQLPRARLVPVTPAP